MRPGNKEYEALYLLPALTLKCAVYQFGPNDALFRQGVRLIGLTGLCPALKKMDGQSIYGHWNQQWAVTGSHYGTLKVRDSGSREGACHVHLPWHCELFLILSLPSTVAATFTSSASENQNLSPDILRDSDADRNRLVGRSLA